MKLKVLDSTKNYIHTLINGGMGDFNSYYTFVYGAPGSQDKLEVWKSLKGLKGDLEQPWRCIGDFNKLRSNLEKKGGTVRPLKSFA